ncbi:MAG: hypothetical protein ACKVVP_16290 [Chloroflexota bacterium]
MAKEEMGGGAVGVPLTWIDIDDRTIELVNQIVITHAGTEIVFALGQAAPPLVLGTLEDRQEQIKRLRFIPVKTLGRYVVTREMLGTLVSILQQHMEKYDLAQLRAQEGEADHAG